MRKRKEKSTIQWIHYYSMDKCVKTNNNYWFFTKLSFRKCYMYTNILVAFKFELERHSIANGTIRLEQKNSKPGKWKKNFQI